MLCFKFHQNHTINEEFDFILRGRGILWEALRGAGKLDCKNSKKPQKERWSEPTPKFSAF